MDIQVIRIGEYVPMLNHEPTQMLEITTKSLITADELWSRIMGSGWEIEYESWNEIEFLGGATWEICGISGTCKVYPKGRNCHSESITVNDIVYAMERLGGAQSVLNVLGDNTDASSADEIMQMAVFGEVLYS